MPSRTDANAAWTPLETVREVDAERPTDALQLLVIAETALSSHPLAGKDRVTIGRTEESDIFLDDPLVSREHAILHLSKTPELEDLGSANGTRLLGAPLPAHQRTVLGLGQVVEMGTTMLILQPVRTGARPRRRLWSHGYFEVRL